MSIDAPVRPGLGHGGVTQPRVIKSEWIKLRSLRSTWWSLLATFVIIVALGILISALRAHHFNQNLGPGAQAVIIQNGHRVVVQPRFDDGPFDPVQVSLRGVYLAQLAIGVLGVLIITAEYSTGMIRASLAAAPKRVPVLIAKAAVFGPLAFIVTTIGCLLAFLFGQQALSSTHIQATLATHNAVRAIIGGGIYLTLIGLLGVGLGFVLRNTASAIATLFGIVLVLPLITQALPSPYNNDIAKYLPLNAGTQLMSVRFPDHTQLSPWAGIGITALYAVAALVVGAIVLTRRDG